MNKKNGEVHSPLNLDLALRHRDLGVTILKTFSGSLNVCFILGLNFILSSMQWCDFAIPDERASYTCR